MSAMMKAPTPMTGGMIWPTQDAVDSTPPAKRPEKPARFIIGMVSTPVEETLAGAEPLIEPNRADATMAHWAGPERRRRVTIMAMSLKNSPAPVTRSTAPRMTKASTMSTTAARATPKMPR